MKFSFSQLKYFSILCFILFVIFKNWFLFPEIIGGDWPFYYPENLRAVSFPPAIWVNYRNNGLGGVNVFLNLRFFQSALISFFVQQLGFSWSLVYKLAWFGLFLFLSILSSHALIYKVFSRETRLWSSFLSSLIFLTNTYILMVVSGGQMGVALAYSLAPLVLAKFISLADSFKLNFKKILIFSLVLGGQTLFDPRMAYISLLAVFLYCLFLACQAGLERIKYFLMSLMLSGLLVVGINAFWMIPLLAVKESGLASLGLIHTAAGAVKFFSFAQFENTLSLLHPNWPENIFGKIYFMKPEFLLIPLIAFTSLLFINQLTSSRIKKNILFFGLLGLIGAFLAKGAHPPLEEIYLWLFEHWPGFFLFRDPTKFYPLIIVAYSLLIPFSLVQIKSYLENSCRVLAKFIPVLFLIYWLILIKPAWANQLGGTFKKRIVPLEYLELKEFLLQQETPFRILWVPRRQRFSFETENYSSVEAAQLFNSADNDVIVESLNQPETQILLAKYGIKYLIIPYDSEGELFLRNRKYDQKRRFSLENDLDKISWLKKIKTGKIAVYETPQFRRRFWLEKNGLEIEGQELNWVMKSATFFHVSLKNAEPPFTLVFSESFDREWIAAINGTKIYSQRTNEGLNSFLINQTGDLNLTIYYEPQKYLDWGLITSGFVLGLIFFVLKFQ